MPDLDKIKEIEKRIDELSADLQELRKQLNSLQGKETETVTETGTVTGTETPRKTFRLENFIGLRLIHFVGIIVLVIGLSIGVKYFIDKELISEATRITLAYAAGLILYLLSLRLRKKYSLFSAILFSGSMASLYFTTYTAFVYYAFFSFAVSFGLMVLFTIYTVFEAIRYNRQEIAILGMIGAYSIPFLISANAERPDLYFFYVLIINIGIVFLSFIKKWKVMGQLALVTTWVLMILWGFFKYEEKDFVTGLIIVSAFYILFTINALAFRLMRSQPLSPGDIQQVMTNNIALYLSMLIIFGRGDFGTNAATTTGFLAIFMILCALLSYAVLSTEVILQQTLAMQAVSAVVLFIGFQWSGLIVTLAWVTLAIVLFVWGIMSHRSWPRFASILLMSTTLGKLIIFDSSKFTTVQKIIAYLIIGTLLLVLSFLYQKYKQRLFQEK